MPGIFGLIKAPDKETASQLSVQMATALQDAPGYQKFQYTTDGMSIGVTGPGMIQSEPQPGWNESKSIAVVVAGEIYDASEKRAWLQGKGHQFQSNSQAELFAHFYEEVGEQFVSQLNGAFAAAIWDQGQHRLLLLNDHLGLYPLYYLYNPQRIFSFASGVRALLVIPNLPRNLDHIALAQFLTFDHMLDDRTLLEQVKLLPPASILRFENGQTHLQNYWHLQYLEHYPIQHVDEYQEELLSCLRQASERQMPGPHPAGVLLSGGLDSRVIAALLNQNRTNETIRTFTFGSPKCDDVRYAKEISAKLGFQHRFYPLKPDYLIDKAMQGVRCTDGMQNVVHMHTLANLDAQAEEAEIIYKGFLGDALMGYGISERHWANYREADLPQAQYEIHRDQGLLVYELAELNELLLPHQGIDYQDAVFAAYTQALQASKAVLPADQRNYFDVRQRVPRMTIHGVELVRSQVQVRLPFADKNLVEFMLTVPPGYRNGRKIIKDLFIKQFPELAKIPYTETNFPMVPCMRDIYLHTNQQVRWWLRNAGMQWVPAVHKRSYAAYNQWLRAELRSWAEGILLSQRTLERGIFNPSFLKALVAEHMAGQDHYTRLGTLISVELWHRQFVD